MAALRRPLLPAGVLTAALALSTIGCGTDADGSRSAAAGAGPAPAPTLTARQLPGAGLSPGAGRTATTPSPTTAATAGGAGKQLPRGGRTIFPRYRLVGYSGSPASPALGRLGIGSLDVRGREIERLARAYRQNRQILPVFELIATMATSFPGKDRMYRARTSDATIRQYLAAARRHRAVLLLNVQPGRADFLPEVRAYELWLREPDVGLALDPEWAVGPRQVPGRVYGSTTGAELDGVAAYVSGIVRRGDLPEKVLVFHQVAPSVVKLQHRLRKHPGVVVVKSVDGIGSPGSKRATWTRLVTGMPRHFHSGFKLFFTEDRRSGRLMTSREVLALKPTPSYVLYE